MPSPSSPLTADVAIIGAGPVGLFAVFELGMLKLSSVLIDANGNATVDWSATLNGTQRSGTVTSSIPAVLLVPNTSVIWGEATYSYKPAIGWVITGTIAMYDKIFLRPRQSNNVVHS